MKLLSTILTLLLGTACAHAALFTNNVSIDAFVRSNAPTLNYGAAGSLTVSGTTATNGLGTVNGIADSFIRFNTAALVASLNSQFGPGNWVINGVALRVVEVGSPNNNIFTRGKGSFNAFWISNDAWTEGTGMPMTPTSDGIAYSDEPPLLTNTVSLGTFTNAAANSTNSYSFALAPALTDDISAGGEVGLYLTAASPGIGFTFNSQNFTMASQKPLVIISAVQKPAAINISQSGTDFIISATNGAVGQTYTLLTSTNLFSPLDQWTPVATNLLDTGGDFSITNPGTTGTAIPAAQFFILQTH
ncbi:MAG TPA: hypothetical protein VHC44_10085 [Verrucomicrobiae bacterium]|nr:hypothetical protein [Verrucomicrobiae bacterium]